MPRVKCPACDRMLNVPDATVGQSGSCPACKHRFTVPGAPETPLERQKPRKKKRKKAEAPAARSSRRWLVLGAAIVGAGLLVGWLLLGGGGGSSPAREPKASFQVANPSTVYAEQFPPADPASWKVAAEAAGPTPSGLRPAIPCPAIPPEHPILTVAFADPSAATAAVVLAHKDRSGVPWWQVSLAESGKTTVVNLTDPTPDRGLSQQPGEVALSPSGDLLATVFSGRFVDTPTGVVVWGRDGHKQREWVEGKVVWEGGAVPGIKRTVRGMWFTSADRLLVLADDALVCREVSTGREVYRRPLKLVGDAVLTPRRTWLLAGVEGGVEAIATADGSSAGRLTIPGFRPDRGEGGGIRLAVSPDGARLASLTCCETGVAVAVWTLSDGKPVFARYRDGESKWQAAAGRCLLPPLHWMGDRHLAMGGNSIFDLDLGGMTFTFGPVNAAASPGITPDARMWRLMLVPDAAGGRFPAAGTYLTATAVPPLPDGGVVLGPHTSFRVEAEGASGSNVVVRETLADGVADRGYRVAPAAELTFHFQGEKANKVRVHGKEVLNPKWDQRPPPGYVLMEVIDGYEVKYTVSIRDRQGRSLWEAKGGCDVADFESKGRALGWTIAAKQAARHIPPGLIRLVPGAAPVTLPLKALARADGTAEVLPGP